MHTTKLLADRFKALCEWKKNNCKSQEIEHFLNKNKIALIHNATEEELNCLFGKTNEQDITKFEHIINVATLLKIRFPLNIEYQETLDMFLENIRQLCEK